jgi:glycosyltransferase involved in cell wall biosynthesis
VTILLDIVKTLFQINAIANSGSTGRIAEEIGRVVQQYGWNSYIAYGRWNNSSSSILYKIGNKLDIWWHVLVTRLFDKHGKSSKKSTRKLVGFIESVKPDIIHLHNIHGYYLNYEILFEYLSSANIPVVWTLHDCWAITGHCVHFQDIKCDKWKKICSHCPNIKGYPRSLFCDRSMINYIQKQKSFTSIANLTLVPVCNWLNDILEHSFLKDQKRQVIVNGIDLDTFTPQINEEGIESLLKIINGRYMILAVATVWNETKGLNDILTLRNYLSDEVIVVVGLTKKQIKKLPIGIIGIERTENVNQLVNLYLTANVFINPTYQDTLPTVNIEALACGTPVITYDTGGCADIVNSDTGFVVERGNISGLVNALFQIKRKGKASYLAACRDRAILAFDKRERYKDYMSLYNQLLQA